LTCATASKPFGGATAAAAVGSAPSMRSTRKVRRSPLPWSCAARYHALVAVVGIFSQAFLLVPVAAATVVLVVRLGARLPNAAQ
jgi:hypothetical protein